MREQDSLALNLNKKTHAKPLKLFMKLSIVYFGTPSISADLLDMLLTDRKLPIEISTVVTAPDAPVGRRKIMTPSPVKLCAQKHGIPVFTALSSPSLSPVLQAADICLVFAYGGVIPKNLLTLPRFGFLNIHPSLLPALRGPSPLLYSTALTLNDVSGVTIIKMDEKIDHGAIITQKKLEIGRNEKLPDFAKKATKLSYNMIAELLVQLKRTGKDLIVGTIQNDDDATYTRRVRRDDGLIHSPTLHKCTVGERLTSEELPAFIQENYKKIKNSRSYSPLLVYNMFRGFYPWPGVWTKIKIKGITMRLKLTDLSFDFESQKLIINKVQLAGKKEVDFEKFKKARKLEL